MNTFRKADTAEELEEKLVQINAHFVQTTRPEPPERLKRGRKSGFFGLDAETVNGMALPPMHVAPKYPERLDLENSKKPDHDTKYMYTTTTNIAELHRWCELYRRYQAGAFAWEHNPDDPRNM